MCCNIFMTQMGVYDTVYVISYFTVINYPFI